MERGRVWRVGMRGMSWGWGRGREEGRGFRCPWTLAEGQDDYFTLHKENSVFPLPFLRYFILFIYLFKMFRPRIFMLY